MTGLVPAIHVFYLKRGAENVDARLIGFPLARE
jgi:hypothetical protein